MRTATRWYRTNQQAMVIGQAMLDNALPDDDQDEELDCSEDRHDWRYDSGNSEMTFYRCACCGKVDEH